MPGTAKYSSSRSVERRTDICYSARFNIQTTTDHLIKFADAGSFAASFIAN
uniref:Uncharacterized protein n=1 Tax=Siphoviridae sp. ctQNW6 TaxID=2826328 RepID=A0A8S5QW43_9CAUD|nr:MAG TPA: hypothetical protein [Siphoviridae sp. ctQNW6]